MLVLCGDSNQFNLIFKKVGETQCLLKLLLIVVARDQAENTLPAFIAAIADGADGIETDVHLSRDGQLIIMHDELVDRTTNGTGRIVDHTLAELKQLDAGVKYASAYAGTRIPTLDEVVQLLIQYNFTGIFNLEIKTNKIHYEGIEDLVADYFNHHQVPFTLIYSSFYGKSIERLHVYSPKSNRIACSRLRFKLRSGFMRNTLFSVIIRIFVGCEFTGSYCQKCSCGHGRSTRNAICGSVIVIGLQD